MPVDPRKRQKKLERRAAKQKEKKKALVRRSSDEATLAIRRAATAPVLHCLTPDSLWDQGMGQVLFSRELPDRRVAVAMFLVDAWCLGVKDAFGRIMGRLTYDSDILDRFRDGGFEKLSPECGRKLVEGAVAYALDLGFHPHPDYQTAKLIFGDVDAGQCDREFTFGKDGKPYFFAGPHDDFAKCQRIIATLRDRLGEGGFHFTMPISGGALPPGYQLIESDSDEGDEDEFE
jgi:hypothetical protein